MAIFYYKIWDFLRFLTQSHYSHINIYIWFLLVFFGGQHQKSTEHANREIWPTNSFTKVLTKKTHQGPGPAWVDGWKRGLSHPTLPREKRPAASTPSTLSTPSHSVRSQTPSIESQEPYAPPDGPGPYKWQDIWELATKPVATDRHIPREFTGMWQGLCIDLLSHPAPMEQEGPDRSDLFYVLPKLVLARPQRAETRKARIERLNR